MFSQHRGPVVVGVLVAALVAGPAWAGHSTQTVLSTGSAPGASLAAKKKASKGTLAVVVSGSGSYTVTGKGFRKTGTASKSFKVKPGSYTIKAADGSVKPGKVKVRKGKTTRVTVTFATTPAPAPSTPPPTVPVNPVPTPPPPTPTPPPPAGSGAIQRVSTDAAGIQADDNSFGFSWSPDGTRIALDSSAANLVAGDTNGKDDVFVKTLSSGAIQRISTDASGDQADGFSLAPVWSPDGTRIAFESQANNLSPGDSNSSRDVFVKTLATGAIQRISTDVAGVQADKDSFGPKWSPDGTRIAFYSDATNMVPGDTNDLRDVFVKTLDSGAIQRVSVGASGVQGNDSSVGGGWSPDGTQIAFASSASNLVSGDTNNDRDVFVKTLTTGAIQRVSVDSAGGQANDGSGAPTWAPDGTRIAFLSDATNLTPGDTNNTNDLFVRTFATGVVERVNTGTGGLQTNGLTYDPAWSPDSTQIAFSSGASNLVADDTNSGFDVFVKSLTSGAVGRISVDKAGLQANSDSATPEWSADGTRIAFISAAGNLVPDDTNTRVDVFVKSVG